MSRLEVHRSVHNPILCNVGWRLHTSVTGVTACLVERGHRISLICGWAELRDVILDVRGLGAAQSLLVRWVREFAEGAC